MQKEGRESAIVGVEWKKERGRKLERNQGRRIEES